MRVLESRGVEGDAMKAGAEPSAGTTEEALYQAATGQKVESGMAGTSNSTALCWDRIVFEDRKHILSPAVVGLMSLRRIVWGPPHTLGDGDTRFDCLMNEK